jgi:TetR/AcrR family transcriptional regulator, transcriptional repressor for nem operon
MRNPDATKERILKKSGMLFNTQGYKATSISNITDATGFTKGAIYRHFESKEELENETLYYLSTIMFERLKVCIKDASTAPEKLKGLFTFFESYITNQHVKGGCPLLNAAIEADDANPTLRKGALRILNILRDSVITILKNGIRYNQLKKDIDLEYYATLIIASLEGAIMMSKLRGDNEDIRRVVKHLRIQIQEIQL